MSLFTCIESWARHTPNKPAIVFEGETITYATLAQHIDARTRQLVAMGVSHGERIAFLGYNNPEMLYLLFACARLGSILVPLNWRLAVAEHVFMLKDCEARLLIAEREFAAQCDGIREQCRGMQFLHAEETGALLQVDDDIGELLDGVNDDPVLLVYTSGTTGTPKGALLTQNALLWNAVNSQQAHGFTTNDLVLTDLPMFHVGGLNIQTLPALHCGATVRLLPRFDPQLALLSIREDRPTAYLMVPATMQAILNHPLWPETSLDSLRVVMTGSTNIPEPLLETFLARGLAIGQIYGLTETCPIATVLRVEDAARKLGSCGKAATHCEVRVVDDEGRPLAVERRGEIEVRGPALLREYWRNLTATTEAFNGDWFRTGDIGHWDEDGFLYLDDRKIDVIISGGENIYPAELENVLGEVDRLAEYAVVGQPDERWGEVPVAVVVPKPGETFSHDDTLGVLGERIARFKLPKRTVTLASLPRNAMGKVLKHELRAQLGES